MTVRENDKALDFTLPDQDGMTVTMGEFAGKWVALYFYPKDNTSGCSLEAADFTGAKDAFGKAGAVILGVSPDSQDSHRKFIEKKGLSIRLLSDTEKTLIAGYGLWQKKKLYGREYFGVARTTLLVDPKGRIAKVWENVKVPGHVAAVLDTLQKLK
jgi:peroxiredoxin Q/BCP